MRRVRDCLSALAIVVALVATVSCARSDDERHLWWDGSAPFKERQSIQAYQEVVEARLGEYVTRVGASSGPVYRRALTYQEVQRRLCDNHCYCSF